MKILIYSALMVGIIAPLPALSQQLNAYQVCHTYQEQYTPGYYTNNGSYVQGGVYTLKNTVNCQTGEVYSSQPYNGGRVVVNQQPYYRRRNCNPNNALFGSALGYGLGSALSNGGGWSNSGSWNRYYGRNRSSGSWSNSYRNKSGWSIFGAGLGGLLFSC
jgi:hypothetical protein